jgi:galactokinase
MTSAEPRTFDDLFGRRPAVTASAPGRVNLIGEHTDYNGGYVLPTVIPQTTVAELAPREDRTARVWSANVPEPRLVTYVMGTETRTGSWSDYVQGITWVFGAAGYGIGGFDARVTSGVPLGSGLSSSAALEISLMRALRTAFDLALEDVPLARLARRAENEFVGAPVGIMDQMACSLAGARDALFLDTRTLDFELVPLPADVELAVVNSGVAHNHAKGDYRTRRAECEEASRLLGVPQLRDLGLADLPRVMALPDPLGRRARHVITEDDRVLAAVRAMRAGDADLLGRLFLQSHASMRDDYEVSVPEVDVLVEEARVQPDAYGARLTGGGFGGAVVVLTKAGAARRVAGRIASHYRQRCGRLATVLVPEV